METNQALSSYGRREELVKHWRALTRVTGAFAVYSSPPLRQHEARLARHAGGIARHRGVAVLAQHPRRHRRQLEVRALLERRAVQRAPRVPLGVALQVAFERRILKPGFSLDRL